MGFMPFNESRDAIYRVQRAGQQSSPNNGVKCARHWCFFRNGHCVSPNEFSKFQKPIFSGKRKHISRGCQGATLKGAIGTALKVAV